MRPFESLSGKRRLTVSVLFGLLLLGLLRYALDPTGSGTDLDLAYYLAMGVATVLCGLRAGLSTFQRGAWILITVVLFSDFIADLSWYYFDLPYPSFADAIWLLSYVWMIGAVLLLLKPLTGRGNRLLALDWLIATMTTSAIGVLFLLPPIFDALPPSSVESAVTAAYPIADIVVLSSLIVALTVGIGRPSTSLFLIIVAGTVWVVGDAVYGYQVAVGSQADSGFLDLTWPTAAAIIAVAAWAPAAPPGDNPLVSRRAGGLSGICMIVALLIIVPPESARDNRLAFYLALAALGVGIARLILTQRENRRLLKAANSDPLTGVNSRAKLASDMASLRGHPVTVAILDLDGFKFYNDSFGHPAGDVLLQRIAHRLTKALTGWGEIYRIGGDEFCVLLPGPQTEAESLIPRLKEASSISGEGFEISASIGTATYPGEEPDLDSAIAVADERMYVNKYSSRTSARGQVHEVLVRSIREREPELANHTGRVSEMSLAVAREVVSDPETLDVIERAAQLHDVGKVAIPDAVLSKPGPLDEEEWQLMRQHTLIGERIIAASPALAPVASLVRSSHEHWDGSGYPDGLSGEEIPLGSRIILACDAYEAMTSERPYSPSIDPQDAVAELRRQAGAQFDPEVTNVLISLIERGDPATALNHVATESPSGGLDKSSE